MLLGTLFILVSLSIVSSDPLRQAPVTLHTTDLPIPVPRNPKGIFLVKHLATISKEDDNNNGFPESTLAPTPKDTIPMVQTPKQNSCRDIIYTATESGQQTTIRSSGWPNGYPANQNCSYFVYSPPGTQITIACTVTIACPKPNDYIFWSLSGDEDFTDAIGYCGSGTIERQTSIQNSLSIGFHSESGRRPPLNRPNRYRWECRIRIINAVPRTTPKPTTKRPVPTTTTKRSVPTTTIKPPNTNCTCGIRNLNGTSRIVGGNPTKPGEIPWRVTVFVYNPRTNSGGLCGGTIISRSWVMTAAHCTMDFIQGYAISVYTEAQDNPVTVGGGVENHVDTYYQHPSFNRQNLDNDITLLHLAQPLTFKSNVSPACLPLDRPLNTSDYNGTSVLASGWGTTKPVPIGSQNNDPVSTELREVVLPVLTTQQCREYMQVTDNQFCTYKVGKDTCQGDSGGSIDYQYINGLYYAIGITSFGYGCAQEKAPGAYAKVTKYLNWISTATTPDELCRP